MRGLTKLAPGPGNVALAERPEPAPAAGHVVLEVAGAGICGTDLTSPTTSSRRARR